MDASAETSVEEREATAVVATAPGSASVAPPPRRRRSPGDLVRLVAVLVFAVTAFLPLHSCGGGPAAYEAQPAKPGATEQTSLVQVPRTEMGDSLVAGYRSGGALQAVWRTRTWYPYLLVPAWLLVLALADAGGRARRAAQALVLALTVAISVLELFYLTADFAGFLPVAVRAVEIAATWFIVLSVLFVRVGGRPLLDPAAAVSAQALLSLLHGLTFPVADARRWMGEGHRATSILSAVLDDYRPAFWLAMVALALAAAPAYVPRRRLPEAVAA